MASYNELNALIDAYINRNGVQAITGQILNGVLKAMVEQLGRGYTIMGAAIPATDPGTPDGPECYFASETGTYTDFDGLQVVPGELALLCYTPTDGWTKNTIYEGFQEVGATIDGNVGTPSVGVSYANGVLSFDFRNLKGNTGDAAGFGTIGATVDGNIGTPSVIVQESGPATAKNLQFEFKNLKGETGVTSVLATVDDTSGNPQCAVSLVGQQLTLAFSGLKGAQGNTGSSVDYPFELVNNLTTDDATKALSAAQGVVLDGKISQLQHEVTADISQLEAKVTGSRQNYSSGYLNGDGVVNQYAPWLHSVDYVPVSTGDTVYWNPGEVFGSAALVIYDANKVKIGFRGANAVERTVTISEQNAAYARLSFAVSNKTNACLKVNGNTVWTAIEEIFGVEDLIDETEERLEGQITGQSINYQNNRVIAPSGVIYPMSGWIASTDYTPVAPGDVLLWYPNAINGSAVLAIYDSNLNLLQWIGANATQREITVPDGGAFIRASFSSANKSNAIVRNGTTTIWKPKDEILGLEDINYFIGSVTGANSGAEDNISIKDKKVSINSSGVRVNFRGKQLFLIGPFDMPYDATNAPNGAWVIDVKTLSEAVDGANINLTSSIVKYVVSGSEQIKKDVILFTCYYGNIFPVGLFGAIIAEKKLLISLNNVSIVAIDSLNGSKGNVVLDPENKKVTIKKEGVRLKLSDRFLQLTGSADFDMAYDSTNHPNGGWFLKTSAIQGVSNKDAVSLSSDNIVYYSVAEGGYNENILLFACYYGGLIASGILGECLLQRQIDAINIDNPSAEINEAKCKQFAAYFNNSGICETFAFMTDPHLLGLSNSFDEVQFAQYIHTLGRYYDNTPVDWCICGGDWLNNSDYQDIACWKLGYMDATMRKSFKHYFPVLGNHDTNYQGVVSSEDSSRGDLTHQTLVNLMFRENGNTYYKFKGNNTQFYVFDTGTDWEDWMTDFKWGQIDWFANALISDDAEHTVIIQHIYYSSGTTVNTMAANIQAVAGAYNSRTTLTLNGITYDFSGCTGKIACAIAGHSHYDDIVTAGVSVPVWLTTNMMDGSTPTFDLCIIDYTAGKMKSIRIGTGSNREMTLA